MSPESYDKLLTFVKLIATSDVDDDGGDWQDWIETAQELLASLPKEDV